MLTFLEIVLSVDNLVFISIASSRLAAAQQPKAQKLGLLLAMAFRVLILLGLSQVLHLRRPLLTFHYSWIQGAFSGQSLVLLAGGLFLLYKGVREIHSKLERKAKRAEEGANTSLIGVVLQIGLLNIVFSFDSILMAIGLTNLLWIMITAVVLSLLITMAFAKAVSRFVNEYPTIQMLGLCFLMLVGFMLLAEGAHLAGLSLFGQGIGSIPKGYLYFAIFFSLLVEFLNMRLRKPQG